jgi:phage repressor protein C with HTH and peptisase S24 domain
MKPRIKDGEYVVVEPNHQYLPGDEVLIVTKDERAI